MLAGSAANAFGNSSDIEFESVFVVLSGAISFQATHRI
jgi:hypothetical protein